jgi:hypothetical protein
VREQAPRPLSTARTFEALHILVFGSALHSGKRSRSSVCSPFHD